MYVSQYSHYRIETPIKKPDRLLVKKAGNLILLNIQVAGV